MNDYLKSNDIPIRIKMMQISFLLFNHDKEIKKIHYKMYNILW